MATAIDPACGAARIAILMCTYNGRHFLEEQLESIAQQRYRHWCLWVSDDGSTDGTAELLARYRATWGADKIHILKGPSCGSVANFMFLIRHPGITADLYAYADQDDVWLPHKLERAAAWFDSQPRSRPALYGTRTELIDAQGHSLGLSPLFTRPPDFRNALVQTMAGGNTMVINQLARHLLMQLPHDTLPSYHDWWTYMAISAVGGGLHYDPRPSLRYRQHGNNLNGENRSFRERMRRLAMLLRGDLRTNNTTNLRALRALNANLPPEHKDVLCHYEMVREGNLLQRLYALAQSGIYRQSRTQQPALYLAAALRRL
ncbi:glycosyltransferase family 2 protein [Pigmentiphaga soli]|uniref:Glycosyltransferase family 2 protein n=1 Tax=Pigmentiphaga soli TaxID=1007095 RepID=A0ABP8HKU6_9BURK